MGVESLFLFLFRFFVSVSPLLKKMVHIMGARDYSEDGHVSTYNEIELYANCICM